MVCQNDCVMVYECNLLKAPRFCNRVKWRDARTPQRQKIKLLTKTQLIAVNATEIIPRYAINHLPSFNPPYSLLHSTEWQLFKVGISLTKYQMHFEDNLTTGSRDTKKGFLLWGISPGKCIMHWEVISLGVLHVGICGFHSQIMYVEGVK